MTQSESGKAFEYALALALYDTIKDKQHIQLNGNNSLKKAQKCFRLFNYQEQENYTQAATNIVNHIMILEPRLKDPISKNEKMIIHIQEDQKGILGDVRDVMITSSTDNWHIGFSAKNNHSAVKHSRLSDKIDFGKQWLAIKCSKEYMDTVCIIFGKLRKLIKIAKQKNQIILWRDLPNKEKCFYIPILNAFEKEIHRLCTFDKRVPALLLKYLLGKNDFYKVMKFKNYIQIQGYNIHGTLNKTHEKRKSKNMAKLQLPTEIVKITKQNTNKLIIIFDKGWQLSFRIHNARSKVEPSLKFDIRLDGTPSNLYSHTLIQ